VQDFGSPLNSSANQAQRFRIALQLQFHKHFGLWLGLSATLGSVFGHPYAAHWYTHPGNEVFWNSVVSRLPGGETMPRSTSPDNRKILRGRDAEISGSV
jgi:hypothetical protein